MGIRFNARTSAIETDASSIDFSQPITTLASTTSLAGLNIAEAVAAPSAPVDGDVWVTAAGAFNARLNGATVDLAAGGAGTTNLTWTASTRVLASDTGTDATITLVTSTEAGLAPLSGGGTTNFLRADGTWAAPAGGSGTVTSSGTPLNNEIAVFTSGTDIDSNANLTFDGTNFVFSSAAFGDFFIDRQGTTGGAAIAYQNDDGVKGYAGFNDLAEFEVYTAAAGSSGFTVDASGNVSATNVSGTNTGDEPAASLTVAGIVELATGAETNTGTDATRAVTPDGLDDWTGSAQFTTAGALTATSFTDSTLGATGILYAGTGGIIENNSANFIWDDTNDRLVVGGVLNLVERADHTTSPAAGRGEVWVKSGALGGELMYTEGDADRDFTAYNVIESTYHFDQTTTAADPGAGNLRWNNATPASVTNWYIDDLDETGRDNSFMLGNIRDGDILTLRGMWADTSYMVASVNGSPTDNTGYWTIPVTIISSSARPTTGDPVHIDVDWAGSKLYAGSSTLRVRANTGGELVLHSDGDTDTENRILRGKSASSTTRWQIGNQGSDVFRLENQIHGGNVSIYGEDVSGNAREFFLGDPDGDITIKSLGDINFTVFATETAVTMAANGAVTLYNNNNAKLATTTTGVDITGDAFFTDNNGIILGTGDDVDIYFSGTNMFIDLPDGADFDIRGGAANQVIARFNDSGSSTTFLGYAAGVSAMQTQDRTVLGNTSSLNITDHAGTVRDAGFNDLKIFNDNVSDTLEAAHAGAVAFKDTTTARTLTLAADSDLDFPVAAMTTVINAFTSTDYTITEGASTTLYYLDGSTRTDTAGGCTVGPGGVANIWRESATVYHIWGTGITA